MKKFITNEKIFWRIILFLFTLLISLPLFSTEYIVSGHDYAFHLGRMEGIKESLEGGQFPVRIVGYWFSDYGEASGIFYPNMFIYIPAFLRLCGVPMLMSYNIFCIIINFATIFITYWILCRLFNSQMKGAVAAMIYSGFLYRLIDIYSRSALGESIAMAFIPLTIISLWLTLYRSTDYWIPLVIGFTGILQSHIISTLTTIAICILIILYSRRLFIKNIKTFFKAAAFTTLLNLWFYVPFVDFYNKIKFHMQNSAHNLHLMYNTSFTWSDFNLVQALCGYWIFIIIFIFMLHRIYCMINKREKFCDRNFILMLIISMLIVFAETDYFPWQLIEISGKLDKLFSILQFPYRFMTFGTLTFTFCLTSILIYIYEKYIHSKFFIAAFCFALAVSSLNFIYTFDKNTFTNISHTSERSFINWSVKFLPYHYKQFAYLGYVDYVYPDIRLEELLYLSNSVYSDKEPPAQPFVLPKLLFDDIRPANLTKNFQKVGTTINFTAETDQPTNFKLPLFYFPGYKAYTSEGERLPLSDSGDFHRIKVEVPAGVTDVTIKYYDKNLWRIANWISFLSLIAFMIKIRHEINK